MLENVKIADQKHFTIILLLGYFLLDNSYFSLKNHANYSLCMQKKLVVFAFSLLQQKWT